jgi:hypothetical protein
MEGVEPLNFQCLKMVARDVGLTLGRLEAYAPRLTRLTQRFANAGEALGRRSRDDA